MNSNLGSKLPRTAAKAGAAAKQPAKKPASEEPHIIRAKVVDAEGKPLGNVAFAIQDGSGKVVNKGKTSWQGEILWKCPKPGAYSVEVEPPTPPPAAAEAEAEAEEASESEDDAEPEEAAADDEADDDAADESDDAPDEAEPA